MIRVTLMTSLISHNNHNISCYQLSKILGLDVYLTLTLHVIHRTRHHYMKQGHGFHLNILMDGDLGHRFLPSPKLWNKAYQVRSFQLSSLTTKLL